MCVQAARLLLIAFTCLAFDQPAYADPIRYDFSGPIGNPTFGTAPQEIGDVLVGSIELNTDALRTTERGSTFRRFEGPVDLHLSFRSQASGQEYLNYAFDGINMNVVVNNVPGWDAFRPGFFDPQNPFFSFGLYLSNVGGDAFSGTDFPRTLDLRAFNEFRMFSGSYWQFDSRLRIEKQIGLFTGSVTTLNGIQVPAPPVVPEPATMLLSGIGVAAVLKRWRRMQQHSS
jgi:hypothetical protein